MKDKIIEYLKEKYGEENIIAVYGIGSSFHESVKTTSDVDVVVILTDVNLAPSYEWTSARFEKKVIDDREVWFLYGDLKHYLNPKLFKRISFADWAWSVRGIKYGSKLLYGKDIRDKLPTPPYNLVEIFKRAMYHLEPTPKWKMEKAKREGRKIDEQMRFSKAIFKFGFFLVASVFPDKNVFDKRGIYNLLHRAADLYKINPEFLKFYEAALEFRNGKPFPNFKEMRKKFIILAVREGMRHLETTWEGDERKKGIKDLLEEGMGKYPFQVILLYYKNYGLQT